VDVSARKLICERLTIVIREAYKMQIIHVQLYLLLCRSCHTIHSFRILCKRNLCGDVNDARMYHRCGRDPMTVLCIFINANNSNNKIENVVENLPSTPALYDTAKEHLFGIIRNVWSKAPYNKTEMTIRTFHDLWCSHSRLERIENSRQ
jgi:hypothetical protein